MGNVAIRVEHLSKMYRLGVINNGTLWKDIQTWAALKLGKEDPHSKIGQDKYSGDEDHFWALKDVSFDIQQGDRVGIIGKNGAGKSTLLKLLSRVTSPTEGIIKVKGKISSLLEVGTGFNGELTGRENIYLNGAILGMKKRQIDRKIDEIIAFSGIEHHIDTPVKRYSSGMYVRLAFAVAAHLDSEILIADEVLAVGDAEFQKKALGKMQDLSTGQGRTVLFVSHQMNAVKQLCNSGIILNNGLITATGKMDEIIEKYLGGSSTNHFYRLSEDLDYLKKSNSINVNCVRINPSAIENGEVLINKEIEIEIEYEVKVDNCPCNLSIHLLDNNENVLFATGNTRSASLHQSELHGIPLNKGNYKTIIRIPPFFLNDNTYHVNLYFVLNNTTIDIAINKALTFSVRDTGEMRQEFVGTWIGSIRPKFYWDTKLITAN